MMAKQYPFISTGIIYNNIYYIHLDEELLIKGFEAITFLKQRGKRTLEKFKSYD
jgi:hypothetical protein